MLYYPDIDSGDVAVLRKILILKESLTQNPDYLNDTACTYPPEVKLMMRALVPEDAPAVSKEDTPPTLNIGDFNLLATSLEVINELQLLKGSLKSLSTNEKISTYRLLISQLEKVTDLMRQAEDLDHYKLFKSTLFDTLERHLSPAQISEFIEDFNLEVKDKSKV